MGLFKAMTTKVPQGTIVSEGNSLAQHKFTLSNASYVAPSHLVTSLTGTVVDCSTAETVSLSWQVDAGVSGSTLLAQSGTVAVQSSDDGVNFFTQNTSTFAVGPGTSVSQGNYGGVAYSQFYRLLFSSTSGVSGSVSAQFATKG